MSRYQVEVDFARAVLGALALLGRSDTNGQQPSINVLELWRLVEARLGKRVSGKKFCTQMTILARLNYVYTRSKVVGDQRPTYDEKWAAQFDAWMGDRGQALRIFLANSSDEPEQVRRRKMAISMPKPSIPERIHYHLQQFRKCLYPVV
ncbi:MAG: hypothetical protein P4M13_07400 [Alphaproteobacteria bacterium]|nr:hypothetical protein [Alphaproteobacteria bacterium]